jgi:prepilin peptidase CpaA
MLPLGLLLASLAVAMVTDIRARRVPNVLVLWLIVFGVVGAIASWSQARSLSDALLGLAVGLALWMPFWFLGLLGAGDVKFFAAACTWLGVALAWRTAVLAAVLGGVLAILTLVVQRGMRRTMSEVFLQYQQASTLIASADVGNSSSAQRTFPYAVPMALALGFAALRPDALLVP